MAVSDEFAAFVREQFSALGEVTTRRMFGGMGVYHDGLFFALIADDTLYLKVDDNNRAEFESAGLRPFEPWDGHVMQYYEAPADALENRDELARWAQGALAAARAKKKPKRTSKRR